MRSRTLPALLLFYLCCLSSSVTWASILTWSVEPVSIAFSHEAIPDFSVACSDPSSTSVIALYTESSFPNRLVLENGPFVQTLSGVSVLTFSNVSFGYSGTFQLSVVLNSTILSSNITVFLTKSITVYPRSVEVGMLLEADTTFHTKTFFNWINNYHALLPNTTITYISRLTTDCDASYAISAFMDIFFNNPDFLVLAGPECSTTAVPISFLMTSIEKPLISPNAVASELGNRNVHPYFLRSIPCTSTTLGFATLEFMRLMAWTDVCAVSLDVLPIDSSFTLRAHALGFNVQAVVVRKAGDTSSSAPDVALLKNSGCKIIYASMYDYTEYEYQRFMVEAVRQGIVGNGYVWIVINSIPDSGPFNDAGYSDYANSLILMNTVVQYSNNTLLESYKQFYNQQLNISLNDPNDTDQVVAFEFTLWDDDPSSYQYVCAEIVHSETIVRALDAIIYQDKIEFDGTVLRDYMLKLNTNNSVCGATIKYDSQGTFIAPFDASSTSDIVQFEPPDANASLTLIEIPFQLSDALANVSLSYGAPNGQYLTSYGCTSPCGSHGSCIAKDACLCYQGYTTIPGGFQCNTTYVSYDDTISIYFPASSVLIVGSHLQLLLTSIAQALQMSPAAIMPVAFQPAFLNNVTVTLLVISLRDPVTNLILLETAVQNAAANLESFRNNTSSLLQFMVSSEPVIATIITKDYIRQNDGSGIAIMMVASLELILMGYLIMFAFKHFLKHPSPVFNWPYSIVSLSGCLFALMHLYSLVGIPTNALCNIRPFLIFLPLSLIYYVKLVKVYRLYRIFNNPDLQKISIGVRQTLYLILLPMILLTIILLIILVVKSPQTATLEAAIGLTRRRAWICSGTNMAAELGIYTVLLLALIASMGLSFFMRLSIRHMQDTFMDGWYVDSTLTGLLICFGLPWLVGKWLAWPERTVNALMAVLMVFCVAVTLGWQFIYRLLASMMNSRKGSSPGRFGDLVSFAAKLGEDGTGNQSMAIGVTSFGRTINDESTSMNPTSGPNNPHNGKRLMMMSPVAAVDVSNLSKENLGQVQILTDAAKLRLNVQSPAAVEAIQRASISMQSPTKPHAAFQDGPAQQQSTSWHAKSIFTEVPTASGSKIRCKVTRLESSMFASVTWIDYTMRFYEITPGFALSGSARQLPTVSENDANGEESEEELVIRGMALIQRKDYEDPWCGTTLFVDSDIKSIVEVDASQFMLRLYTESGLSFLIKVRNKREYSTCIQSISQLLSSTTLASMSTSAMNSSSKNVATKDSKEHITTKPLEHEKSKPRIKNSRIQRIKDVANV